MSRRLPRLCVHPGKGYYYIRIARKVYYLGKCDGTPGAEAHAEAERLRLLAEWQQAGALPGRRPEGCSINVLLAAYLTRKVETHYRRPDGSPTSEQDCIRMAIRPLQRLYGHTRADAFSPRALKALQGAMADGSWMGAEDRDEAGERLRQGGGWCRKVVNRHVGRIRRLFAWGVSEELVPVEVYQALLTVGPLLEGRSAARETDTVPPAPRETIDALLAVAGVWKGHEAPWLSRQVADMMRVQLATWARPGEVCALRPADIDRTGAALEKLLGVKVATGDCWAYLPPQHKTAHHGRKRIIPLGPVARALLTPYLAGCDPAACVFSPAAARAERHAAMRAARQSKVQPSQVSRRREGAGRQPGQSWTTEAYSHAIARGIERLNTWRAAQSPPLPPLAHFSAHQLRHNAATDLQRQFGWDIARLILGHATVQTTQIYVAEDYARAFRAAEQAG